MRITRLRRRYLHFVPVLVFIAIGAEAAVEEPADVENLSPQYRWLERALHKYEEIAASGGWPTVPGGPTIRPGDRDSRLAALARRLAFADKLANDGKSTNDYNKDLQDAVRRFQSRHGLDADALVGPATLRALNVPVDARIEQIRINLRRTRHLYDTVGEDALFINIPAFEARLLRNGEPTWTSRIIIGETDTETPLFESEIARVVLNPTWTVPRSIATEELLPKIRNDPGFLARGAFDVLASDGNPVDPAEVEWATLNRNNFPYSLVQRPGPMNELGQVKFPLPNEYGVCMHDTPGKHLFARSARAYSHGCIRLENPLAFAAVLLEQEGWTPQDLDTLVASMETRTIDLAKPLPVIVTYLTATADEAGTVYFYTDIYRKDAKALP